MKIYLGGFMGAGKTTVGRDLAARGSMAMKEGRHGLLGYLVIGVIGALLGGWLFGVLGIGGGGLIWSLITAFVGAVILIFLLRLIRRH